MDLGINQSLQQEQRLILTAEMKMSLKLLQMPIFELKECIEKELDENPLLEIDYDDTNDSYEQNDEKQWKKNETYDYKVLVQQAKHYSYTNDIVFDDDDEDSVNNPFNYISKATTLKDYLKEQLLDRKDSKLLRSICYYLIDCINEDGFITEDMINFTIEKIRSEKLVRKALEIIQDLQPCGIGAKDFKESLILQLKKIGISDEQVYSIIEEHMDLLADNKIKELAKKLNTNIAEVQKYTLLIKSLEPKPSRGFFTGEETKYIVPEGQIKKIGDDYFIIMNDDILPKLNINSYYQKIIMDDNNQEAVTFVKDKVGGALNLIKGIEQRRNTIYRILEKIIDYQRDYFDKGEAYLKPMNLNDLAVDLNLHESTVSRAIKDKYICIPAGTVKIKDLFTNGIVVGNQEDDISSRTIKKEISKIIKEEDKMSPLSDQTISEILSKMNFSISRRTVTKYREELGIKSSGKRKLYI